MGQLADQLYKAAVSERGLFGKAFFGHKKTKHEDKVMDYLWAKAQEVEKKELAKIERRARRLKKTDV